MEIKWKKLESKVYEIVIRGFYFYLSYQGKDVGWCLNIFNDKIKDNDEAYIDSLNFDTKEDVEVYIREFTIINREVTTNL